MGRVNNYLRMIINRFNQKKLKNKEFTLISSNCNGCLICHDLNVRFNSPFVNLYLEPKHFIKYIKNMEYYNECEISFVNDVSVCYPIGMLDDISLHFVHYESEKQARDKWNERVKRINLDNMFILMSERDGCTMDDLINFDNLTYKNKVVFTHLPYKNIKSSFYISGFEEDKCVGECFRFKSRFTGKKYYDDFNYVKWFNEGKNQNIIKEKCEI